MTDDPAPLGQRELLAETVHTHRALKTAFLRAVARHLTPLGFTQSGPVFRRIDDGDVRIIDFEPVQGRYSLKAAVFFKDFGWNSFGDRPDFPRGRDCVGVYVSQLVDRYPTNVPYRMEDLPQVIGFIDELLLPWLEEMSTPAGTQLIQPGPWRDELDKMWAARLAAET
jgi:hypothetical protein